MTKGNGDHLFVPIIAKRLASGTNDDDDDDHECWDTKCSVRGW